MGETASTHMAGCTIRPRALARARECVCVLDCARRGAKVTVFPADMLPVRFGKSSAHEMCVCKEHTTFVIIICSKFRVFHEPTAYNVDCSD